MAGITMVGAFRWRAPNDSFNAAAAAAVPLVQPADNDNNNNEKDSICDNVNDLQLLLFLATPGPPCRAYLEATAAATLCVMHSNLLFEKY